MKTKRPSARVIAGAALVLAIALALWQRQSLDLMSVETALAEFGVLAPLAYMALYALATVLFVPGTLFGLLGGALFGPTWGTLWNLLGATLGAALAFLVARFLLADWVARKSGARLTPLLAGVEREGWRFVAFTRLVKHLRQPKLQWTTTEALRPTVERNDQLLLDVRSPEEFTGPLRHLPGAQNVPLPELSGALPSLPT